MILTEVLDNLGIDYRTESSSSHVTEGWVGLVCKWCDEGTGNYGLGINKEYLSVSCWKCGGNHSLAEVFHEYAGISWQESNKLVESIRGKRSIPLPEKRGKLVLPDGIGPMKAAHRSYLKKRGLDPEELEKLWQFQGIAFSSRLPWRIFIPIVFQGKTVSWTTRSLSDQTLRYINAKAEEEELSPKSILYGEDYARHSIIVVEGSLDAVKIGPGSVATMGVKWTEKQAARIAKYPCRCIAMDSEPEAQRQAKKLCDFLSLFPGKTRRLEVDAKDPGSLSKREVALIRKEFLK